MGLLLLLCFPGGSEGKESACNAGDRSSIPGLGRSLGEGNGNPLHYSCLENPMDRGATVGGLRPWDHKILVFLVQILHYERMFPYIIEDSTQALTGKVC